MALTDTLAPAGHVDAAHLALHAEERQAIVALQGAAPGSGGSDGFDFPIAAQGGSIDNADRADAAIALANATGGTAVFGPGVHRTTRPFKTVESAKILLDHGAIILPASGYTGGLVGSVQDGVANGTDNVTSAAGFPAGATAGVRVHGIGVPSGTTVVTRTSNNAIVLSNPVSALTNGDPLGLSFGAALFTLSGKGCEVSGSGTIRGGVTSVTTSTANPALGAAIHLVNGASFAKVDGITFTAVNGYCVLGETWVSSGLYDGKFTRLGGNYNGRGLRFAGFPANRDGQIFMDLINFQVVDQGHGIDLDGLNDVQVGTFGACVSGSVPNTYGLRIAGDGSSYMIDNYDAGAFPVIPGASGSGIIIGDGGTPNNVWLKSGVTQGGNPGLLITGGFNIKAALQYSRSAGPGVKVTGGDLIDIVDGSFARNGKTAAADNCEVEVTSSTARVRVARNTLSTPVGTTTEKVAFVVKLPLVNRVTWAADNIIAGGHVGNQIFPVGKPLPEVTRVAVSAQDIDLAGWSVPPDFASGSTLMSTAGRISGADVLLPVAAPIGRVWMNLVTPGTALAGGNLVGIFDANNNLLDVSDDQAANWMATAGVKPAIFAGGSIVRPPGWYRIGFFFNGTGTAPTFGRGAGHNGINLGRTRYWTADTGRTTMPSTLTGLTAQSIAWSVVLAA